MNTFVALEILEFKALIFNLTFKEVIGKVLIDFCKRACNGSMRPMFFL